ncbi:MAG: dihydroorotate dehydrogenase electron transfer subunit [Prevotella sp.]|nr:dihydroorotate dehydrogenase electron transfer subunit [Prevotella sp.]
MKKYCIDLSVKEVRHINDKYVLLILTDSQPLPEMLPGQFVEVRVDDSPQTFLRRPISINDVDYHNNELHLLVACIGDGTRRLGRLLPGDTLNVMLPLGNGFTLPAENSKKHLLVGGGVGVAPLLYLGRKIREMGAEPTFLLGARSAGDLLLLDDFRALGRVFITTEDGTEGERGFVTDHSLWSCEQFDLISTCGPKPMMAAVSRKAQNIGTECEVSLENKMACGLGACLCCVEKTNDRGNICICTEGPVINAKRLTW